MPTDSTPTTAAGATWAWAAGASSPTVTSTVRVSAPTLSRQRVSAPPGPGSPTIASSLDLCLGSFRGWEIVPRGWETLRAGPPSAPSAHGVQGRTVFLVHGGADLIEDWPPSRVIPKEPRPCSVI